MSGITLHPTLGVNARLTICSNCGGPGDELMLMGNRNYKLVCPCGMVMYGGYPSNLNRECPKCHERSANRVELTDGEKVLTGPCSKCRAKFAAMDEMVKAGGVYWKCSKCKSEGALVGTHPWATATREKSGIAAPKPVGIEFTEEQCPVCTGVVNEKGELAETPADPPPDTPADPPPDPV